MAIKFDKIKPGMILLDIHREKMGNTTMRQWRSWRVEIISVDAVSKTAVVHWNGNPPVTYRQRELERLYIKEPKHYRDQRERRAKGSWL